MFLIDFYEVAEFAWKYLPVYLAMVEEVVWVSSGAVDRHPRQDLVLERHRRREEVQLD
jgi:hypothetical protein